MSYKKVILFFFLLSILFTLQGCTTTTVLWGRAWGTGAKSYTKYINSDTGREVVMVGMIHMEKPEFYDEVRLLLDSLKSEGYVVFCEGVTDGAAPPRLDTVLRKIRRVTGMDLDRFYAKKVSANKRIYVKQSNLELGLTTDRDFNVDLTLDEMVRQYEDKYDEEIVLSDYDWNTPLTKKYRPRKAGKEQYNDYTMIHTLRERHIIDAVRNSPYDKIVLLYGQAHWYRLSSDLFWELDFKKVGGKKWR